MTALSVPYSMVRGDADSMCAGRPGTQHREWRRDTPTLSLSHSLSPSLPHTYSFSQQRDRHTLSLSLSEVDLGSSIVNGTAAARVLRVHVCACRWGGWRHPRLRALRKGETTGYDSFKLSPGTKGLVGKGGSAIDPRTWQCSQRNVSKHPCRVSKHPCSRASSA